MPPRPSPHQRKSKPCVRVDENGQWDGYHSKDSRNSVIVHEDVINVDQVRDRIDGQQPGTVGESRRAVKVTWHKGVPKTKGLPEVENQAGRSQQQKKKGDDRSGQRHGLESFDPENRGQRGKYK